ncbi:MAG: SUMF1/EgtB/PvdO family nonheme iron enzyme [Pseudomonadota bacterium]
MADSPHSPDGASSEIDGRLQQAKAALDRLRTDYRGLQEDMAQGPTSPDSISPEVWMKRIDALQAQLNQEIQARQGAEAQAQYFERETHASQKMLEGYARELQEADQTKVSNLEMESLRKQLEMVRARAEQDTQALQKALEKARSEVNLTSRATQDATELLTLRQEAVALRNAAREKLDKLDSLSRQCRALEDSIEDRDAELDSLRHEIEELTGRIKDSDQDRDRLRQLQHQMENQLADLQHHYEDEFKQLRAGHEKAIQETQEQTVTTVPATVSPHPWKPALAGALASFLVLELALWARAPGEFFGLMSHDTAPHPVPPRASEPVSTRHTPAVLAHPPTPPAPEVVTAPPVATPAQGLAPTVSSSPPPPIKTGPPQPPRIVRDRLNHNGEGPPLVLFAATPYAMGNARPIGGGDERPRHEVKLSAFAIGQFEVTFDDYDRYASAQGRSLPQDAGWGRGNRPVIFVSWEDAQGYVRWLASETGKPYRLPSEAEWEYAASGGLDKTFWWGQEIQPGRATCMDCGTPWDGLKTAPVGSFPANPLGLHDTVGNVVEWVEDCYHPSYQGAPETSRAWITSDCSHRVARGGGFSKPSESARVTARTRFLETLRVNYLGFRVARDD